MQRIRINYEIRYYHLSILFWDCHPYAGTKHETDHEPDRFVCFGRFAKQNHQDFRNRRLLRRAGDFCGAQRLPPQYRFLGFGLIQWQCLGIGPRLHERAEFRIAVFRQ